MPLTLPLFKQAPKKRSAMRSDHKMLAEMNLPRVDRGFQGRRLISLVAALLAAALASTLIVWFLSGRIALLYRARADRQFQAGQYSAALQSYASALRFDSRQSHGWLYSGYTRQA